MLTSGRRSRGGAQRGRVSRLDSDIAAGLTTMGIDDSMSIVLPQRNIARKVGLGILAAGLVAGGFYFGTRSNGPSKTIATAPAPAPAPPSPPPAAVAAHAAQRPRHPRVTPTPPPPAAAAPPPPSRPRAGGRGEARAARRRAARARAGGAARWARRRGRAGRSVERPAAHVRAARRRGRSRAGERQHGQGAEVRRRGAAAAAERRRGGDRLGVPLAGQAASRWPPIGEFKRALNNSPNFPQALFGVGEAYRSAGDPAQAIDAYKKYLAAAPGGEDAPAARRQLRELESQPARPSHSTTTTVPDPGSAPPPMPAPAPPP